MDRGLKGGGTTLLITVGRLVCGVGFFYYGRLFLGSSF